MNNDINREIELTRLKLLLLEACFITSCQTTKSTGNVYLTDARHQLVYWVGTFHSFQLSITSSFFTFIFFSLKNIRLNIDSNVLKSAPHINRSYMVLVIMCYKNMLLHVRLFAVSPRSSNIFIDLTITN